MKKILIVILITLSMFSITSYAGEWKQNDHGYWYQNDDGSYVTGWYQDVDGKWYYFDDQSGYMLTNTITPDGYVISESGEWIEGGEKTINYSSKLYDNKTDLEVTAYKSGPSIEQFGYTLPTAVYYNNEYESDGGRKINISSLDVSKEGILYAQYSMSKKSYYYELSILTRYVRGDGSCVEVKKRVCSAYLDKEFSSAPIMEGPDEEEEFVSAEVYIDMGDTD